MPTRPLPIMIAACLALSPAALAQSPAPAKPATTSPPAKPAEKPKDPPKPADDKPAESKLHAGDKAPGIKSDSPTSWVRGEPLTSFESGKVTVVEFWATWCPSCREAMPKLAKRAKLNKDYLSIIAVASSEKKEKPATTKPGSPDKPAEKSELVPSPDDPRLEGVKRFAKDREDAMPYRILFDGSRSMANDYLVAAGQKYLPFAFIIDPAGTILWQGDPRAAEFDTALDRALKAAAPPEPPKPDPKADSKKPGKSGKPSKQPKPATRDPG